MGAFRVLLGSLHYMGLYIQLSVCTRQAGHGAIENHISGNGRCHTLLHFTSLHREEDDIGDVMLYLLTCIKQRATRTL